MDINHVLNIDIGILKEKRNPLRYISVHRSGDDYPTIAFLGMAIVGHPSFSREHAPVGARPRENSLLEFHLKAGAPSCPWLSVDTMAILKMRIDLGPGPGK